METVAISLVRLDGTGIMQAMSDYAGLMQNYASDAKQHVPPISHEAAEALGIDPTDDEKMGYLNAPDRCPALEGPCGRRRAA